MAFEQRQVAEPQRSGKACQRSVEVSAQYDVHHTFAALVDAQLGRLHELGGSLASVAFPAELSPAQRRYVHQTAHARGLLSASVGEGSARKTTVYKPGALGAPAAALAAPTDPALRVESISRMLSSVLRHRGRALGLEIGEDGYTLLSDVVKLPVFKEKGASDVEVQTLVAESDEKNRFHVCSRGGQLWIRANQGHTIRTVEDSKLLCLIGDPCAVPCCVHGTYFLAWEEILSCGGLSRMARNHIHFAPRPPGEGVVSGLRSDAEVAVFICIASAMAAGIDFFRSANDVILTRGDARGMVPVQHFQKAVRLRDGELLWPPPHEEVLVEECAGNDSEEEEVVVFNRAVLHQAA